MSDYERVILEHWNGTIGELRIYPTYVGVWYADQAFAGNGKIRDLYLTQQHRLEWDGGPIRIRSVNEGVNVLITPPSESQFTESKSILLKGNRQALLKRLRALFAANPESFRRPKRRNARKGDEQ